MVIFHLKMQKKILQNKSKGTYLLRFSLTERGGFAIAVVTEKVSKNATIKHYKISRTGDSYNFGNQIFDSIETLMTESKKFIDLTTPAPGSKFTKLAEKYPPSVKTVKKKETIVNNYNKAGGDQDYNFEPARNVRKFEKPITPRKSNNSDSDSSSSSDDVPLHRKNF